MNSLLNHYDTLGVSRHATNKEIREAYRELAKALHPDKNKFGTELMKRVNEAYRILSNQSDRSQHDNNMRHNATSPEMRKRKKTRTSPPTSSSNGTGNEQQENATEWEKEFLIAITCIIYEEIVDSEFYETSCCAALYCVKCANNSGQLDKFRCQNKSCLSYAPSRVKSNNFINIQIDKLTTLHACGKRIYKNNEDAMDKHKLICPKLNTSCIKCSGKGKYTSVEGSKIKCGACNGRKFLPGLDWMDCFKCKGRGAYDGVDKKVHNCTTCHHKGALNGKWMMCFKCKGRGAYNGKNNKVHNCTTCHHKGALHGKWTMCFKCQGVSAYNTISKGWISCSTCNRTGAFKGYNLLECSACKGCGCIACKHKGHLPCMCGSLCKGHSKQYTKR